MKRKHKVEKVEHGYEYRGYFFFYDRFTREWVFRKLGTVHSSARDTKEEALDQIDFLVDNGYNDAKFNRTTLNTV